jgi:hypothetical protein
MQHLKYSLLALIVTGLFFLGACDGGDEPTPQSVAEKIAVSWKVQSATQSGSPITPDIFDTGSFRITFTVAEGQPTTYSVTPGNVPDVAKPNYNGTTDSGNWTISGNTVTGTIVLQDAAATNSNVSYSYNETDSILTLTWTVPQGIDKTEPTYTFVLEQA